jgi:hypothetical protein
MYRAQAKWIEGIDSVEVVIVEFAVGPDLADECASALRELMTTVVAKQEKFHGATIHKEKATGTVVNVMRWDRAADFVEFRDSNQAIIGPVLNKYGPKGRMFQIVAEIAPNH